MRERPEWGLVLRELSSLVDSDESFPTIADRAVDLGAAYLGVEHGHITRIVPDLDHWEAIASTDSDDGFAPPGFTVDLRTSYCRRAIAQDDTIALSDATEQGWEDDIAYETHGLSCYVSTPYRLDGGLYGTLCFADKSPRPESFDEVEIEFVELLARILETKLQQNNRRHMLASSRKLTEIYSRLFRHNLRNELNVVRGYVRMLVEETNQPETNVTDLEESIDAVIGLAEKTHDLQRIARMEFELQERSITAMLTEAVETIEAEYPNASITTTTPDEVRLLCLPTVETALRELLENAVEHAVGDPTCSITVEQSTDAVVVTVADQGTGLPVQERRVLQGVTGTSLSHGSGVGLWIVRWVIDTHEGSIDIDASESGTVVSLRFPRPTANPWLLEQTMEE